jgi:putative membrane protein
MQQRKLKHYLIITLKGIAMGAADVVPGVSGGTIAFISGIYEELLSSISSINIQTLKKIKTEGLKGVWKAINGNFLVALLSGIFISVVSLAKLISWLLEHKPVMVWSFFFGLVLASILYVGRQITKWSPVVVIALIIGSVLAFYITTLQPLITENASPLFLFLAGALAICAMILPGISGAFILVLLGAYKPVLDAVHNRDVKLLGIVAAGAIVGLLTFSNILKWLFAHYKNSTLAVLTGFILGSLNKIWPWKNVLESKMFGNKLVVIKEVSVLPNNYVGKPELFWAILLALLGFIIIILLEKAADYSTKK